MTKARDLADLLDTSGNLKAKQGRTVGGRDLKNDGDKLDGIEANATADQDHSEIRALIEVGVDTNVFTDADHTKLDGIEAGATADQTKADIDALNIDADTLDGQHGSYYTDYTDTAVANLVDSSPGTLDTLNELAAALGDDPNFATTTATNIGTKANKTITVSAGSGLTGGGDLTANRTISHADTSSQASVNNSNGTVIQDITLDTYGHITSLASVNLDSRYYTETEADSRFVNVTGDTMSDTLVVGQIDGGNPAAGTDDIRVSGYGIIGNRSTFYVTNPNTVQIGVGSIHNADPAMTFTASQNTSLKTLYENSNRVFTDGYHPNADKWTTSRTLSLSGDASGSVSWDGSANATLSVTVANDSHTHDTRYVKKAGDTMTGSLDVTGSSNIRIGTYSTSDTGSLLLTGSSVNKQAVLKCTNGNLHIDSNSGNTIYLNYYAGNGVAFGSGANGTVAWMGSDGDLWKGGGDNQGSKYWHAGNDGSGSGLDADLLDGVQGSNYLRSDITSAIKVAQGTTAQRPSLSASDVGYMRYNTTNSEFEFWHGSGWTPSLQEPLDIEFLLVGGGGGGGGKDSVVNGASGASGALVSGSYQLLGASPLTVIVGGGGSAGATQIAGYGGGGGGSSTYGSGGPGGAAGGSGTSGAGGGGGGSSALSTVDEDIAVAGAGGGGGGANEGNQNEQSAGGGGVVTGRGSQSGSSGGSGFNYGGDGGGGGGGGGGLLGGTGQAQNYSAGASGGTNYASPDATSTTIVNGPNGASNSTTTTAGASWAGSSGFGYNNSSGRGGPTQGSGGSGRVIIRYQSATVKATGGTVTSSGGYQIHTFTSNGTFTPV